MDIGEWKYMRPKPFHFFGMWTEHGGFLDVVRTTWNIPVSGDPSYRVV